MRFFISILAFLALSMSVSATEIAVWDKTPIEVRFEVGKERLVHVPGNVEVQQTSTFRNNVQFYNAAGTLYITPYSEFPKQRMKLRLESGEIIYVDFFAVTSESEAKQEDFKIIHKSEVEAASKAFGITPQERQGITVKQILQYAHIDKFGVPRLKPNLPITETEINSPLNLDLLFIGRSAGLFDLNAIKQYRSQQYTVTAIHLQNKTSIKREIKLKDLYPAMIAASPHHFTVEPAGHLGDETILFVVTNKPLSEYAIYSRRTTSTEEDKG
ncbi:DUF3438 family protein [Vibrio agarivorans]|uniref:DUF3438 family protein n=1 Tax=Vibrio agarivorans TaxID=153622 RepID=A0ABT7Y7A6_9VIBR|nr:DUF3438 family protein [Vibrio agarivorans]MDN2483942.1 DUF3438 family protein [Vibrio agarivorans]